MSKIGTRIKSVRISIFLEPYATRVTLTVEWTVYLIKYAHDYAVFCFDVVPREQRT